MNVKVSENAEKDVGVAAQASNMKYHLFICISIFRGVQWSCSAAPPPPLNHVLPVRLASPRLTASSQHFRCKLGSDFTSIWGHSLNTLWLSFKGSFLKRQGGCFDPSGLRDLRVRVVLLTIAAFVTSPLFFMLLWPLGRISRLDMRHQLNNTGRFQQKHNSNSNYLFFSLLGKTRLSWTDSPLK